MQRLILASALVLLAAQGPEREALVELAIGELDSPAGPRSELPNLIRGADGKAYLSWVERSARSAGVLKFSVLGEEGWSAAREIVRGEDLFLNWADFPSICALESGVLLAHWLRHGESSRGYDAEFSISNDGGVSWSEPRRLHDDESAEEHGFVSIAALDAQHFGAIWLDGRSMVDKPLEEREMALYFRSISAEGELGAERVLDARVCSCCQTSLLGLEGGGLIGVYRDRDSREVRDIACVRFDGESWSAPELVHADGWVIPGCPVNGPQLARVAGKSAAAWFTGVGEGGGSVLLAFEEQAEPGFREPLDVDDGVPVGRVDLVVLDADSVLVSWMEHTEEGAQWRVRQVRGDGRMASSVTVAETSSERECGFLRMVSCDDGVVAAWTLCDSERSIVTARIRPKL